MSEHEMDAIVERANNQVNLLEDALGGLQSIRATASSEEDRVTAEVDGNGTLTGLWMTDAISTMDARALAEVITATTNEAARIATEKRIRVMTTLQESFENV